jgi:hypothetical protein
MTGGRPAGALTVRVTTLVTSTKSGLFALRVTAKVPVFVGVPDIKPVAALTTRPFGSPVAE